MLGVRCFREVPPVASGGPNAATTSSRVMPMHTRDNSSSSDIVALRCVTGRLQAGCRQLIDELDTPPVWFRHPGADWVRHSRRTCPGFIDQSIQYPGGPINNTHGNCIMRI